jgi:outer membrane protein assembly factor BamD
MKKFAILLMVICWVGCSSKNNPDEVRELSLSSGGPSIDTPQLELLETARRYYAQGLFSVSRESFESLRDGYPLGPYAELAEIKIADTHFEASEYIEAAIHYEEFLTKYPTSDSASYAAMRAGRSFQLSHRGVGRDREPLDKAINFFTMVMARYPDSIYSQPAQSYLRAAQADLARHEKVVLDYYRKQKNQGAYEARKQLFEEKYQKYLLAEPS